MRACSTTSGCSRTRGSGRPCGHTALITAIALPLELIFGFLLAELFLERMPGRQVFVALLVLPTVISPIVAGATWRLMFDVRFGPIGQILSFFAGEPVRILWTVNPAFVYPAIIICEVWQWTPFMFLLLLAALSNVDQSQLEAAELDGASYWRTLRADRASRDRAGDGESRS